MVLQYAILGFLSRSSITGYQLGKIFDKRVNFAWAASLSQIYRELGTLEKNGWIVSKMEKQDDRPDKKIYTITDRGKTVFLNWLKNYPESIFAEKRDEFMLRVFFGSSMGKEELRNHLEIFIEERIKLKKEFETVKDKPDVLMNILNKEDRARQSGGGGRRPRRDSTRAWPLPVRLFSTSVTRLMISAPSTAPNGPRPRPGILSLTGWWTEVWITKRLRPIDISRSAVG